MERQTRGMRKGLMQIFYSLFDSGKYLEADKFYKDRIGSVDRANYSHRSKTFKKNRRRLMKSGRGF